MKYTFVFLVVGLSSIFYSQSELITKSRQIIGVSEYIGKMGTKLYFIQEGTFKTYKIDFERIDLNPEASVEFENQFLTYDELEKIPIINENNTLANALLKFSKQSTTGIAVSLIGTLSSVILPFITSSTPILIVPPVIGIAGYIIWVTSYKHLKTGAEFAIAKNYP